jgi:capsular exopolysaccharide synthesis family protein
MAIDAQPIGSQRATGNTSLPWGTLPEGVRESYQTLLHRIGWPGGEKTGLLRTLGLTSSDPGEGVSTVAVQLALTAVAGGQQRVLLVDANWGRPTLHRWFNLPLEPGLADVLLHPGATADAVHGTAVPNLAVLCAGRVPGNAVLDGAELSEALEAVRTGQDLVIVDLPAAGHSGFALRWAGLLDGVVLVVEAERIRRETVHRVKQLLTGSHVQLLGAVLNKQREHLPAWMYRNL